MRNDKKLIESLIALRKEARENIFYFADAFSKLEYELEKTKKRTLRKFDGVIDAADNLEKELKNNDKTSRSEKCW